MLRRSFKPFIPLMLLLAATLACSLPGIAAPTPFVFPTPDLTLTALFNPTIEPNVTFTSPPPVILTDTPEPVNQDTAIPTEAPQDTQPPPPSLTATLSLPTAGPTSTPAATRTSAGPGMRTGPSVAGIYLDSAPVIDGRFGEWGLDTYPIDHVVFGGDRHNGINDLSGAMMVGWDETNLYLAVRVRDNQYVQEATGVTLFRGDSLELLLDTDVSVDYYVRSLSTDDYQLGISPGSPGVGADPEAYLWYPASLEGSRSSVDIGVEALEDGYRVEAAVPWSLFAVEPDDGDHFGFAVSISDNDREGEEIQQSMVSNVSTRMLTDPTTWGDLTLVNP